MSNLHIKVVGAGEMTPRLKHLLLLQRASAGPQHLFEMGFQLHVTPTPGDPAPTLASTATRHTYGAHSHSQSFMYSRKIKTSKSFFKTNVV